MLKAGFEVADRRIALPIFERQLDAMAATNGAPA